MLAQPMFAAVLLLFPSLQAEGCKLPKVRDELARRFEVDQKARFAMLNSDQSGQKDEKAKSELIGKLTKVDTDNTRWLKGMVEKHGWLGRTLVGEDGAHHAWLLVQHADRDPEFQEKCLELMTKAGTTEVAPTDLAYLTDRVLSGKGKPQRYGTQCKVENGRAILMPVEDPENLDKRRKELGLKPVKEYLAFVERMQRGEVGSPIVKFEWTEEKQSKWSQQRLDESTWDMAMLKEDLDGVRDLPTFPAIRYIPSPGPKYESPGGLLKPLKLSIGTQQLVGYSVAWGKAKFNEDLFKDPSKQLLVYFNILVLTDNPDPNERACHIVSRNHPHYLSAGTVKTKIGDVDWSQIAMAGGKNIVVVSQRLFDLREGRTIVVVPQKDGSLRFLQFKSPDSVTNPMQKNEIDEHLAKLREHGKLKKALESRSAIQTR